MTNVATISYRFRQFDIQSQLLNTNSLILRQQNHYTTSAEKEAPRKRHLLFKRWFAWYNATRKRRLPMKSAEILRQQNHYTIRSIYCRQS